MSAASTLASRPAQALQSAERFTTSLPKEQERRGGWSALGVVQALGWVGLLALMVSACLVCPILCIRPRKREADQAGGGNAL